MLKTKTKIIVYVAGIISIVSATSSCFLMQGASANDCSTSTCNTTFQVDVKDVLSVSVTAASVTYDEGYVDDLLTDQINVEVSSNNSSGFVAGLRASNAQATLTSASGGVLNNLTQSYLGSNFPTGKWGYSTDTGSATSKTYNKLAAYDGSPDVLFSSSTAGSGSESIYFAAKAGYDNPAGTYTGTVDIVVVSGRDTFDETDPVPNPVGPNAEDGTNPYYDSTNDVTTYTSRVTSGDQTTTTTEVSDGDTRISYSNPLGETEETQSNISTGKASLPVILAVTSATSAAIGLGFFIIAMRREEEDEEEDTM